MSSERKKDYNLMIDGRKYNQPVKNNARTYENIKNFATGQVNEYTTGCLLGYSCFKENYKSITIDLKTL